jgi:hypothetical protein
VEHWNVYLIVLCCPQSPLLLGQQFTTRGKHICNVPWFSSNYLYTVEGWKSYGFNKIPVWLHSILAAKLYSLSNLLNNFGKYEMISKAHLFPMLAVHFITILLGMWGNSLSTSGKRCPGETAEGWRSPFFTQIHYALCYQRMSGCLSVWIYVTKCIVTKLQMLLTSPLAQIYLLTI